MTTQPSDWAVELLPCPFCGEPPMIGPWKGQDLEAWPYATAIQCSSDLFACPVNPSTTAYTFKEAVADWNRRAPVARELDASGTTNSAQISSSLVVGDALNAARYRWLRANAQEIVWNEAPSGLFVFSDLRYSPEDRIEMDAAIDTAMGAVGAGDS